MLDFKRNRSLVPCHEDCHETAKLAVMAKNVRVNPNRVNPNRVNP